jgi:hypothetical protein
LAAAREELLEVTIQRLPVALVDRSRRHMEELTREFEFVAAADEHDTPARLLALVEQVVTRFAGLNDVPQADLDAAIARGEAAIDLVYQVPAAVAPACLELDAMLDEADEFCRRGELLTLATPPDLVAFRRWFLGEFVSQVGGGDPVPWAGPLA